MKAVVAAFNQENALVGAFSVITNLRMELFQALLPTVHISRGGLQALYLAIDLSRSVYTMLLVSLMWMLKKLQSTKFLPFSIIIMANILGEE